MTRYYDAGDIDLDAEEVYDSQGRRITEQYAREAADYDPDTVIPPRGRPSLTEPGQHSPQVRFRVSASTHDQLRVLSQRQGRRISDVTREAVNEYLARHSE